MQLQNTTCKEKDRDISEAKKTRKQNKKDHMKHAKLVHSTILIFPESAKNDSYTIHNA